MFDFFKLKREKIDWKIVLVFIAIAYIFNIWVRFIYIDKVADVKSFRWHNQLMINNVDGYYYLEGARDILAGFHQENDLSAINTPLSKLTAFLAKYLGVSIDTLGLYMPGVFGSLVVIALILIGRVIQNIWVGFLAALLAGIAWSYYHRTMFGYFDTDMLTVTLPTFAIWTIMWALKEKDKKLFFIAPIFMILMDIWHGGLHHISNGAFFMSAIYVLYLKFIKKEDIEKLTIFLLFLLIALLPIFWMLKVVILSILQIAVLKVDLSRVEKLEMKLFWGVVGVFVVIIGAPWIIGVLKSSYFTRAVTDSIGEIKYYEVVNTVREAGHISYDTFVHRISGSWAGFILAVLGYILLLWKKPVTWVSLPMVVLGFFALKGGLRFTIFAVPFMALGNAYLFWVVSSYLSRFFINEKIEKYSKYILSFALMTGVIYPNYKHVYDYIMPTTFNKDEIAVLDKLKNIAKRTDYVLTWWDYGYPIRYYADVKTLVDGGKHSGYVNYPVSFALTRPQLPSYNIAILDVYFTEKHYKENTNFDIVKDIMKMYNLKSIDEVEPFMYQKIELPKIKEDIYYFLPLRMLNIYPTVALFSYIDLKTGELKKRPFFIQTAIKGQNNQGLVFSNGIFLEKNGVLHLGRQKVQINSFVTVFYNKNGKIFKQFQIISKTSPIFVVWMKSYNKVLIMDKDFFNSTFIQLFVFENYDKNLFEPVVLNPWVKVYKVKK